MITRSELPTYPIEIDRPSLDSVRSGNTGVDYVHEFTANEPGPCAMVTALTHGNEYSGAVALLRLIESGLRPTRGSWIICFANVAAFRAFDPVSPDSSRFVDVDMNRVWSKAKLGGEAKQQEVSRANEILGFVRRADYLLDLHSMHESCEPLLLSGPTQKGLQFANKVGFPGVIVRDEGHADGTRMMDFEAFGRPEERPVALLVEAGQHWSKSAVDVSMRTLFRFLVASETIEEDAIPSGFAPAIPQVEVKVAGRCVAKTSDVCFTSDWKGLELIAHAGTVIAYDGGEAVVTPFDDCALIMPSLRQVFPGVTYARFGQSPTRS